MIADRIKALREANGNSQAELARKLGVTRSSVNAWEMGISVPSTQCIVELSSLYEVSTDYLLKADRTATIGIQGLSEEDIHIIYTLIHHLRKKNEHSK